MGQTDGRTPYRYTDSVPPTAANPQQRSAAGEWDRQTDGLRTVTQTLFRPHQQTRSSGVRRASGTDRLTDTVPLHRLCSANLRSANKSVHVQLHVYADNAPLPAFAHRAAVRRAAIDRYLLPAAPQLQSLRTETDGRTDTRQMHRPCCAYFAGGVSKADGTAVVPSRRLVVVVNAFSHALVNRLHTTHSSRKKHNKSLQSW